MSSSTFRKISKAVLGIFAFSLISAILLYAINFKSGSEFTGSGLKNSSDTVIFKDVGQGDCTVIYSRGRTAIIDTGTPESAHSLCKDLKHLGINEIDALVLTHFHDDHFGGSTELSENFIFKNLIIPDISATDENTDVITELKKSVLAEDGEVYTAETGMNFKVGNFTITIIGYYKDSSDENDKSLCLMAENSSKKILFTGDATSATETLLIKDGINIDCDILKVGHHGSKNSSCEIFLEKCSPEFSVISSGKDNLYSHPNEETLERLENIKTEILRTDNSGDISFEVKNSKIIKKE